jgi:L-rhamnose mutarotase
MKRIAFKMKLFPGQQEEYKRRHDELWPEMQKLLRENGVSNFSIFLDEETNILFAYLEAEDPLKLDELPDHPVQKKWWTFMKDIMETNPDHSPVQIPLKEMFYFP